MAAGALTRNSRPRPPWRRDPPAAAAPPRLSEGPMHGDGNLDRCMGTGNLAAATAIVNGVAVTEIASDPFRTTRRSTQQRDRQSECRSHPRPSAPAVLTSTRPFPPDTRSGRAARGPCIRRLRLPHARPVGSMGTGKSVTTGKPVATTGGQATWPGYLRRWPPWRGDHRRGTGNPWEESPQSFTGQGSGARLPTHRLAPVPLPSQPTAF